MEVVQKTDDLIEKIKRKSFFKFIPESEFKEVVKYINILRFSKGEVIVKEGERPGGIFAIISGRAKVIKGSVEIATLEEEDFFGESEILLGRPAAASVIADEDKTETIYIIKGAFDMLERTSPRFSSLFYKMMAKITAFRLVRIDEEYLKLIMEMENQKKKEELKKLREEIMRIRKME